MPTFDSTETRMLLKKVSVHSMGGMRLVPFDGSEIPYYERWFNDPDVLRYLHPNTPFTTDPQVRVSVPEFIEHVVGSATDAYFRIEHPAYGFIGHSSMTGIDYSAKTFRRGCVIGETQHWGKGIGTFVGKLLLSHAENLGFETVKASVNKNNIASLRNLQRRFQIDSVTEDWVIFRKDVNDTAMLMNRIGIRNVQRPSTNL